MSSILAPSVGSARFSPSGSGKPFSATSCRKVSASRPRTKAANTLAEASWNSGSRSGSAMEMKRSVSR